MSISYLRIFERALFVTLVWWHSNKICNKIERFKSTNSWYDI